MTIKTLHITNSYHPSSGGIRTFYQALLQAADLFVHPNPREPFGIAPLEAMAAGLPLVAPASGGLLMYADRHNAWLAEDSAEAFAAAIGKVLALPELRRQRTEMARRTAEALSWTHVTADYFRHYDYFHQRVVQEGTEAGRQFLSPVSEREAMCSGAFANERNASASVLEKATADEH